MVAEAKQASHAVALMPGPQWEFWASEAKYPGLFSGRAGGKTVGFIVKAMTYMARYPGSLGCLTEPTFAMLRDVLIPCLRQFFGELEGSHWEFRRADMELACVNGSKALLRPALDPEKGRGLNLAFFGMDEIAVGHQQETFVTLQGCLRQSGFPHQGWVTSTPHWRKPWIRQRWKEHVNPSTGEALDSEDYPIFRAETEANWFNPPEFVASLRATYPSERFAAQELYGEFITVQGAGFPQFDERIHIRTVPEIPVKRKVIGVDFGAVQPTACEEFALGQDGRIYGTWEFYERQCSERDLVRALSERNPQRIVCDPTGKDLIEMLKRYGLPARAAKSNDFGLRARLWGGRLDSDGDGKPGIYLAPNQPNLIGELQNLAYYKPQGMETLVDRWEPGSMDHGYDAGSYALMEFDAGIIGRPKPSVRWNW